MTPMTGRITNAHQYRLVLCLGTIESLFAPGIPIHRIVRMLQKVGRGFLCQPVCKTGVHHLNNEESKEWLRNE
jgi:hypothetical protein